MKVFLGAEIFLFWKKKGTSSGCVEGVGAPLRSRLQKTKCTDCFQARRASAEQKPVGVGSSRRPPADGGGGQDSPAALRGRPALLREQSGGGAAHPGAAPARHLPGEDTQGASWGASAEHRAASSHLVTSGHKELSGRYIRMLSPCFEGSRIRAFRGESTQELPASVLAERSISLHSTASPWQSPADLVLQLSFAKDSSSLS